MTVDCIGIGSNVVATDGGLDEIVERSGEPDSIRDRCDI
jgi:hypothetical protein